MYDQGRLVYRQPDPLRPVLEGTIDMAAAIAAIERRVGTQKTGRRPTEALNAQRGSCMLAPPEA